jgi:hypothetical protein
MDDIYARSPLMGVSNPTNFVHQGEGFFFFYFFLNVPARMVEGTRRMMRL